jgi:ribosome-binding factor A
MGKYDWRKHEKRNQKRRDREGGDGARTMRLQELIREELNFLLRGEVRDPRLDGVEITMVELSGDGSRARAWFTSKGEESETEISVALDGATGFLRDDLAESLGLKRTPDLRFRRDPATHVFADETKDGV